MSVLFFVRDYVVLINVINSILLSFRQQKENTKTYLRYLATFENENNSTYQLILSTTLEEIYIFEPLLTLLFMEEVNIRKLWANFSWDFQMVLVILIIGMFSLSRVPLKITKMSRFHKLPHSNII